MAGREQGEGWEGWECPAADAHGRVSERNWTGRSNVDATRIIFHELYLMAILVSHFLEKIQSNVHPERGRGGVSFFCSPLLALPFPSQASASETDQH